MTIQFNCPNCDAVIGFDDKHKGKHAHCTSCGQHFIIPSENAEKVKKFKLPKQEIAVPIPGFYHAVFVDTWKIFNLNSRNNIAVLFFIAIIVLIKFYVSEKNFTISINGPAISIDLYIPLGWVLWAASWGLLFLYYCELIYSTAFDEDKLPQAALGGDFGIYTFIWKIFRSLYTILAILLVAGLPYFITFWIFQATGIKQPVILYILIFYALVMSPMAILNVAVGQDLTLLRPDYLLLQISRAFLPYIVPVLLLTSAGLVEKVAHQYTGQSLNAAAGQLALNLVAQFLILVTMRSIGLFYRHYSCCFPW